MNDLITEADKVIRKKIEDIAKASAPGSTSGKDTGLTKAALQFLTGHPLEAGNLTDVWSRHLGDLKSRMSTRIAQMTDISNPQRTLGWTIRFCRTVVPELLARMLAVRYGYAILSNEGVYNYNANMLKEDEEFAD